MAQNRSGSGHPFGGGTGEKAKDFKGSLIKLIKYMRRFLPAVIAAMVIPT